MAETPGAVLDPQATGELQQKRPEGGSVPVPGEINDAQAGKATAAGIREQLAAGRDPGSVLGNIAAGEIGAEKPLPPKVQEQKDKMKALGKEKGIDDLRINIEEDERYKKIVDKYKEQLSVDDFKDRYRGFAESPEFFRDREARVQALEEFSHDPATAEAAKLYEQHSVWFNTATGEPDSSRDVYYERAGKEAEDKTREALLTIQPNPIYQQHVREDVPGDEERHREAQRLYDMQHQLPELYFTAMRDAYSSHNQTISQDVKEAYGNQETATRDVFAQEQVDWLRDVDKDVFNNGSSAVHRSLVVKAFLGPDAPQVKDENIIRAHFVIDTVSLSGQELAQRLQQGWEQVRGNQSIIRRAVEMLLEIKAEIDAQQQAKKAPSAPGDQPTTTGNSDETSVTQDSGAQEADNALRRSQLFIPRPGESFSTYRSRVEKLQQTEFRREDFEQYISDIEHFYKISAEQYKKLARENYQARRQDGDLDFDEAYKQQDGEERSVYKERVREALQIDLRLPRERFDLVFEEVFDHMFPPPSEPSPPPPTPEEQSQEASLAQQIGNAIITDTQNLDTGLTRDQQQAKMEQEAPGFTVSVEKDSRYRQMLEREFMAMQEEIDTLRSEMTDIDIDRRIYDLKQNVFAEFMTRHPKDAEWYRKNSRNPFPGDDPLNQTRGEVDVRRQADEKTGDQSGQTPQQ